MRQRNVKSSAWRGGVVSGGVWRNVAAWLMARRSSIIVSGEMAARRRGGGNVAG